MESGDKIRYFFEAGAIGKDNELVVPEEISLNKVGHALATLNPVFGLYTLNDRIRDLCRKLGYKRPSVSIKVSF
jgi:phytanoyl-CoA hydroxylase